MKRFKELKGMHKEKMRLKEFQKAVGDLFTFFDHSAYKKCKTQLGELYMDLQLEVARVYNKCADKVPYPPEVYEYIFGVIDYFNQVYRDFIIMEYEAYIEGYISEFEVNDSAFSVVRKLRKEKEKV